MTRVALLHRLRAELAEGGLRGSFLVRDLRTGVEIGIDPDIEFPSASLVKVPLAAATLERIRIGELDGAAQLEVEPGRATAPGPTGLTRFRHPVRIAIDDLLYLSVAISDGTASDALFGLTPPDQGDVTAACLGRPGDHRPTLAGRADRHAGGALRP
jgi:beta-lactamase class A